MLEHLLKSSSAFFDTTPLGRIVNRFSKDIDEVDLMIPTHIKDILSNAFSVIGTIVVLVYASPYIMVLIVPMIGAFFLIQSSYLAVSRQLKRMVCLSVCLSVRIVNETLKKLANDCQFGERLLIQA